MKFITELLEQNLLESFKKSGYEISSISVTPCTLGNMGDYQCNDCMPLAKTYHKAPFMIAENVVKNFSCQAVSKIEVARPGYINITLDNDFLSKYIVEFMSNVDTEITSRNPKQKIIVDYGGANVCKPLHVGHLRSATIGESIKRICQYVGNETIGDVHWGDWGLQMGLIIAYLKKLHPEWEYFDANFSGEYPKKSPLTLDDLETIYPQASKLSKEDEDFLEDARKTTRELQNGNKGYYALWKHFNKLSKNDILEQYSSLNVHFESLLGESDSQEYCKKVVDFSKQKNLCRESEGALIVDIARDDDKKTLPPFMLVKSDGAVLYSTTEVATILMRAEKLDPDRIIYVVDNRQELHFTQVFRFIEDSKILNKKMGFNFVGFGTMNGQDGKPYKTRDGGVMQLKLLIQDIKDKASSKANESGLQTETTTEEKENISNAVAISALKFADLSIFRSKDYIFDIDKFCSFDGKTGPYILYTITRAKSILRKFAKDTNEIDVNLCDRKIVLLLTQFATEVLSSYNQLAPSVLCDYVYKLANMFNSFYAKTNILKESDAKKQASLITLTKYTLEMMEKVFSLLGIETLEKM